MFKYISEKFRKWVLEVFYFLKMSIILLCRFPPSQVILVTPAINEGTLYGIAQLQPKTKELNYFFSICAGWEHRRAGHRSLAQTVGAGSPPITLRDYDYVWLSGKPKRFRVVLRLLAYKHIREEKSDVTLTRKGLGTPGLVNGMAAGYILLLMFTFSFPHGSFVMMLEFPSGIMTKGVRGIQLLH